MTAVQFHFNVGERMSYACRLLRKASRQGARLIVTADARSLAELDRVLWTFDPVDFVPHLRARTRDDVAQALRDTPIWLMDDLEDPPHQEVLVNLGELAPTGYERFARLIEIVSQSDADRARARARWKHYAARGDTIERHEVGA